MLIRCENIFSIFGKIADAYSVNGLAQIAAEIEKYILKKIYSEKKIYFKIKNLPN